MFFGKAVLLVVGCYLIGSVNFAIIITRLVSDQDIRKVGTGNPGTANVGRSIGRGWACLVLLLDSAKILVPLMGAGRLILPADTAADTLILFAAGIAAIGGHCWPLYYRFSGGRGIATSLGVFLYFVPVEQLTIMLILGLAAGIGSKALKHKIVRWGPFLITLLTPLLVLSTSLFFDQPLVGRIRLGGHPWYIVLGTFFTSLFILLVNLRFMGKYIVEFFNRRHRGDLEDPDSPSVG